MASRNERKKRAKARHRELEQAVQAAFRQEAARAKEPKPLGTDCASLDERFPERYQRKEPKLTFGTVTIARGKRKVIAATETPTFGELRRDADLPYGQRRKRWIG